MNKSLKFIFQLFMLIIILSMIFFGYSYAIEPYSLEIISLTLEDEENKILETSAASDGSLRVGVFSDTHFSPWYTPDRFDEIIEVFNEQEPDIIFFTGDLFDNYDDYAHERENIIDKLSQLSAPLGKYAVFGNHDYGAGAEWEYEDIMEEAGFTVLVDEYFAIEELNIGIVGIDDMLIGNGITDMASWGRDDYYNFVICHEPDTINDMLDYNVDLMLAGHSHGGQVKLPLVGSLVLPPMGQEYVAGLYTFDNDKETNLFVTKGLGTTQLPLRFMAKPDVAFIDIL